MRKEHTIYHVSVSIEMMLGWPDRRLEGFNGMSAQAVRTLLEQQLAAGRTDQLMQRCDKIGPHGECLGHRVVQELDGTIHPA